MIKNSDAFKVGQVVKFRSPNMLFVVEKMIVGRDLEPNKAMIGWFDAENNLHRAIIDTNDLEAAEVP